MVLAAFDSSSDLLSCLSIDWIQIASDIELNYSNFDGFVILHGTDTMSYTSSALSFMLEDLGKTVVRLHTPSYSFVAKYSELPAGRDWCSDSHFPTPQ